MTHQYRGAARRLVVAFDIGTTYSGVAYSLLDPGEDFRVHSITKYPGHEYATGSTKIPTIICYDRQGRVKAVGAEAVLLEQNDDSDERERQWTKVDWFKLRLRPRSMPAHLDSRGLSPLPPGKSVIQVLADYMAYLMKCAESFIKDTHPNIQPVWKALRQRAEFVLGHPNGWEGQQQTKMRRAAVLAGLVPDTPEGRSRITFVTEGEASLHYCIRGGVLDGSQKGFVIADLGGGTLDYSAYSVTASDPLQVVEVAGAKCDLEGSVFVTIRAKGYLYKKLSGSKYGHEDAVEQICARFDEVSKKTFRSKNDPCLIPFGSAIDKDPDYNIRAGKLRLLGEEVATYFENSVRAAVNSIKTIVTESKIPISAVYLVGGFSASPYAVTQLTERLAPYNIRISIPDNQTAKAVAEGAISFYLDHYVSSRVAKVSYGVRGSRSYKPNDPEHNRRKRHMFTRPSGHKMVNGAFVTVLEKGTAVSEEKEFKRSFSEEIRDKNALQNVNFAVIAYRGPGKPPDWEDQAPPNTMKQLFVVSVDVSILRRILQEKMTSDGVRYWRYEYDLVVWFGGTELRAQAVWTENGSEKRGTAKIIYDGEADDNDGEPDEPDDCDPYPIAPVARLRV